MNEEGTSLQGELGKIFGHQPKNKGLTCRVRSIY